MTRQGDTAFLCGFLVFVMFLLALYVNNVERQHEIRQENAAVQRAVEAVKSDTTRPRPETDKAFAACTQALAECAEEARRWREENAILYNYLTNGVKR